MLPKKATEIRNSVAVISRHITNVPTPLSYLNFLHQNFATAPETDDMLSVTNYLDKITISEGYFVMKFHAMFSVFRV
jgi:hypothetical protein